MRWAEANREEAAAIGRAGQAFAQTCLTAAAALAGLRRSIVALDADAADVNADADADGAAGAEGGAAEDDERLARGDWATNRAAYDASKMYYRYTFIPESKERRRPLALLASRGVFDCAGRDLYQFGVYTGSSMRFWLEELARVGIGHGHFWGFDSFEGLPEEEEGMPIECKAWLPGAFSAADQFDADTYGEVKRRIEEHIGPAHGGKYTMIKGFFSDSLTPTLAAERGMQPAMLVDVDVDLYISAVQCLDWMFAAGLIVAGTVVYYDDVSVVKEEAGELRAHNEVSAKYGVRWRKLHDSCWEVVAVTPP